ncbi:hypothetical protein F4818DRAFT_419645, partial [Hypoxylon cercidicola]
MTDSLPAYPDDRELLELIEKLEGTSDYPAHARKQKIDYSVLLNECAKVKPTCTMTLEDYANANNELRWAVTPVLIQHVGGKSSHGAGDLLHGRFTDDMPFDYNFEMNDPMQLMREHHAWIDKIKSDP